jgi:hypothetical protein
MAGGALIEEAHDLFRSKSWSSNLDLTPPQSTIDHVALDGGERLQVQTLVQMTCSSNSCQFTHTDRHCCASGTIAIVVSERDWAVREARGDQVCGARRVGRSH